MTDPTSSKKAIRPTGQRSPAMKEAHCPYCGRWLVRLDDAGDLAIAGKSGLEFKFDSNDLKIKMMMVESGSIKATPDLDTARCLRLLCRARRWFDHG